MAADGHKFLVVNYSDVTQGGMAKGTGRNIAVLLFIVLCFAACINTIVENCPKITP